MKLWVCFAVMVLGFTACEESEDVKIYNESNTNVIDGVVYDINEKPINGLYKIYYSNGNVKMEVESKDGKPHGSGRFYNEDGILLFEGEFVNGLMDGKMLNYFEDGSVRNEMHYVKGKRNGTYKTFNPDGTLAIEVEFEDGLAISGYALVNGNKINLSEDELVQLSAQ